MNSEFGFLILIMKFFRIPTLRSSPVVLLLFAMPGFDYAAQTLMPPAIAAKPVETQEQVISAIKKLSGSAGVDKKSSVSPVRDG